MGSREEQELIIKKIDVLTTTTCCLIMNPDYNPALDNKEFKQLLTDEQMDYVLNRIDELIKEL